MIAPTIHADGETVIAACAPGANDFLVQPLKRTEFRDAIARLERAPKRTGHGRRASWARSTRSSAPKAESARQRSLSISPAVLAQRKHNTVLLDLDWTANDCAMQMGAAPQYTLTEVGENLARMDQALFEGFVTRDPLGFFLVGPPDALEHRGYFTEPHVSRVLDLSGREVRHRS